MEMGSFEKQVGDGPAAGGLHGWIYNSMRQRTGQVFVTAGELIPA